MQIQANVDGLPACCGEYCPICGVSVVGFLGFRRTFSEKDEGFQVGMRKRIWRREVC